MQLKVHLSSYLLKPFCQHSLIPPGGAECQRICLIQGPHLKFLGKLDHPFFTTFQLLGSRPEGFFSSMHCVGLVASTLLSVELICTGRIWEEREVGEFASGSPCFLALLPRAGLPPC